MGYSRQPSVGLFLIVRCSLALASGTGEHGTYQGAMSLMPQPCMILDLCAAVLVRLSSLFTNSISRFNASQSN